MGNVISKASRYPIQTVVIAAIVLAALLLIAWATDSKGVRYVYDHYQITGLPPQEFAEPPRATISPKSRFELITLLALKRLFPNEVFATIRPDFLKYPPTGQNLELDWACLRLKKSVECEGDQHFNESKYFHGDNPSIKLAQQKARDTWKEKRMRDIKWQHFRIPWRNNWTVDTVCDFLIEAGILNETGKPSTAGRLANILQS